MTRAEDHRLPHRLVRISTTDPRPPQGTSPHQPTTPDAAPADSVVHMLIGYARVSVTPRDRTAQVSALRALGVDPAAVYVDRGLTGTDRDRPGLRDALARCSRGDTLVVTALARLARSVPDARDTVDQLAAAGAMLRVGADHYCLGGPDALSLCDCLALVADLEADLVRLRTREGMAEASAKGHLRGRRPTLTPAQERQLVTTLHEGSRTASEVAEIFGVSRATVYRAVRRVRFPGDG